MCVFFMHVVPLMQVVLLFLRLYLNSFKANGVSVIQLVPDHVYDWFDVKRLQCKMDRHRYFFSYTCSPSNKFKTPPSIPYINSDEGYILLFLLGNHHKATRSEKTEKNWFFTKTWKHLEYFIRIYLQTIHHH